MEDTRYIHAIEKLANDEALCIYDVCDATEPDRIAIQLAFSGIKFVEVCDFRKSLVIEWVDNGEIEGKNYICAQIKDARKRLVKNLG